MTTYCTCWANYPNKAHKKNNGTWRCVDKYRCVRKRTGTSQYSGLKTKCVKVESENNNV